MANVKITDLTAYTDPVSTDVLPIVDVGNDLTKKVSIADLLENAGTGSAGAPSFSFDGDNDTGIYRPGANQLAISTNGIGRLFVASDGRVSVGGAAIGSSVFTARAGTNQNVTIKGSSSEVTFEAINDANNANVPLRNIASQYVFNTGPSERLRITSTGQLSHIGGGSTGSPAVGFNGSAPSNSLVIDSTGNVGVGVQNPSEKLEVYGNARFKATDGSHGIELYPDVGGLGYQRIISYNRTSSAYEDLSFGANDFIVTSGDTSESLRITSAGLVGIGTSAPDALLTISSPNSATVSNTRLRFVDTDTTAVANQYLGRIEFYGSDATGAGAGVKSAITAKAETTGSDSCLTFSTSSGSSNDQVAMTIDSSQRVGMGTSTPSEILHISASTPVLRIDAANNNANSTLQFLGRNSNGTQNSKAQIIHSVTETGSGVGATLNFLTTKESAGGGTFTSSMFIDKLGNVGIGTTDPGVLLQVADSGDYGTIRVGGNNSGATGLEIYYDISGATSALIKNNYRSANTSAELKLDAGKLTFCTGASGLPSATIDSSGRVGIGTTSPTEKLSVNGKLKITNDLILAQTNGRFDYDNGNSSGALRFHSTSANTERMRLDSSGRLGIGTSTPGKNLHVVSSATEGTPSFSGADVAIFQLNSSSSSGAAVSIIGGSLSSSDINFGDKDDADVGKIQYDHNQNALRIYTSASERLRITSAGNVGIGTTAPATKFDIIFDADSGIKFDSAPSSAGSLITSYQGSNNNNVRTLNFDVQQFVVNTGPPTGTTTTERMRIDLDGRLLVGTSSAIGNGADNRDTITAVATAGGGLLFGRNDTTTSDGHNLGKIEFWGNGGNGTYTQCANIIAEADGAHGTGDKPTRLVFSTTASGSSSPTERMRITSGGSVLYGTTSDTRIQANRSLVATVGANGDLAINHSTGNFSGDLYMAFGYNGSQIGSITQNGTSAVAFNTSSDYRLKENVVDIADGITRVKQLLPKRFNFIVNADKTVDGFLAHEAQAVVPEAVTGEKDGEEMQGIDQSKLVPLLTAALKEAIAKIETLEQRLTDAGIA